MAFGKNIQFVLGQGGLGTPLPGQDYISGMIFTSATLPTGFSYSSGKAIYSLNGAETLGIVGDYSDETKPTGKLTVGTTASTGTVITIKVTEPNINAGSNVVTLASYTVQSTDTTQTILANNIASAINIGTSGYSAGSVAGASFSVTGRVGIGTLINGVSAVSSDASVTSTAFSGGVASKRITEHYQISEFFRLNPVGVLWVIYQATVGTWDSVNLLQNQSDSSIRQFGCYNVGATTSAGITNDCDALQNQGNIMFNNYAPASILYSPNLYNFTDLSTLPNLRQRTDNYVSCIIGQDGGANGAYLSLYSGTSITAFGAVLGLLSTARVSDDIGWVGKYPITTGAELAIPALGNGSLFKNLYATSYSLLNQIDGQGYIFLMTRPNIGGTFVNDSHCAITITSDYAYIERNRTIDKVIRNSYLELVPLVNSPLLLNADGTLSQATIATFTDAEKPSMDAMIQAGEISAYAIIIDPTQNVQSTSTINIAIRIVGVGVARNIIVTVGYTLSI